MKRTVLKLSCIVVLLLFTGCRAAIGIGIGSPDHPSRNVYIEHELRSNK